MILIRIGKTALAHEFNHNVMFTFQPFNHRDVSLGNYIVIEGLTEVFLEGLSGEDKRGPWVNDFDEEEVSYAFKLFKESFNVKGFEEVPAYI